MNDKTLAVVVAMTAMTTFGAYTYYVVPPGTPGVPENPDYLSWETAGTNIHEAVYLAGMKDVDTTHNKNVQHRLYIKSGTYLVTNQLTVGDCRTEIRSSKGPSATDELDREGTILVGSYPARKHRIFEVASGSVSRPVQLRGLTIRNGYAEGYGGGVYFSGCNHTDSGIYDCTVQDCVAEFAAGGGICFRPTNQKFGLVSNCWVSGCVATNEFVKDKRTNQVGGGGIGIGFNGALEVATSTRTNGFRIIDTVISNNTVCGNAICGSAVFCYGRGAWLENCTIVDNRGTTMTGGNMGFPGAVRMNGRGRVIGCTFLRNIAGGASSGSTCLNTVAGALVTNCTFIGNVNVTKEQSDVECTASIWNLRAGTAFTGSVEVVGCTFKGSLTNRQPALIVHSNAVVRNCLITDYGSSTGDPIAAVAFRTSFCSFENNTVAGCEKALFCLGSSDPGIVNCAFFGNGKDLHQATLVDGHTGISFTNCAFEAAANIKPQPNVDCVFTPDMKFVGAADGDYRLQRRSPLRDAALKKTWMTEATDLDGNTRLLDDDGRATDAALPDIGCYECPSRRPGMIVNIL